MSAIPLAAKLKRDQAARREQALGAMPLTPQQQMQMQMMMRQQQGMPPNAMMMQNSRFAGTNRARRSREEDFLTAEEVEKAMEARKVSGSSFRTYFLLFMVFVIAALTYAKYDVEVGLEVPQVETGKGFGEVKEETVDEPTASSSSNSYPDDYTPEKELEDLEEHFKVLGVEGRFHTESHYAKKMKEQDTASAAEASGEKKKKKVDPDLERRREMWRVKQEVKKARDEHNQAYGTLVACGKACQENHMQVEAAYQALDSILPREVYKTFYGTDNTKAKRLASPEELKATFEEKKKEIEEEMEDEEDKNMALAELKDAYDILRSPEARQYYHLYGRKPVESMKRTSARHGGWGQELMLGTYKYRMIFAILDYFSNTWAETIVIGGIILLLLARLPSIISQTMKMQAVLEAQEELDEMTDLEGAKEKPQ